MLTLKRAIEKATLERKVRDLGKSVEESAALKQAYQKLRELDQAKNTFLSSVSHELRTPLTSIVGYADVSRKKLMKFIPEFSLDNPKNIKILRQVEANLEFLIAESERLTGLIESILDLTAMEAGTAEWKWEPLSLSEVIENTAKDYSTKLKVKGLEFVVAIEGDLPLIKGDRHRISQLLSHLLANAVTFTDQGGVTLSAKKINNKILVSVSDTGKGIIASQHGLVFEKFSQLGDALTDKPKGVGLGLPICRLIAGYHGGKIDIVSEPGKGSVFTILLPVEEAMKA